MCSSAHLRSEDPPLIEFYYYDQLDAAEAVYRSSWVRKRKSQEKILARSRLEELQVGNEVRRLGGQVAVIAGIGCSPKRASLLTLESPLSHQGNPLPPNLGAS
jgi:hypothetical protein